MNDEIKAEGSAHMIIITGNNHKTMAIVNSSSADGAMALGGLAVYR